MTTYRVVTRHDDPDTTTPIDTTTGGAPVVSTPAELDALPVGSVVLDRQGTSWQKTDDTDRRDDDGERVSKAWASTVWIDDHTSREMFGGLPGTYRQVHPFTVLHVPGRDLLAEARAEVAELREQRDQATVALAEAPGFMSVWREAEARGVERARVDLAAQVAQAEATLIAEAEARGVARGRREALTEAANDLRRSAGLAGTALLYVSRTHAGDVARWLEDRARAAETPGGAA